MLCELTAALSSRRASRAGGPARPASTLPQCHSLPPSDSFNAFNAFKTPNVPSMEPCAISRMRSTGPTFAGQPQARPSESPRAPPPSRQTPQQARPVPSVHPSPRSTRHQTCWFRWRARGEHVHSFPSVRSGRAENSRDRPLVKPARQTQENESANMKEYLRG